MYADHYVSSGRCNRDTLFRPRVIKLMNTSFPQFCTSGTVASGNFNPGNGLHRQSQNANWWTSSLQSATNGANTWVNGTNANPGTNSNSKFNGLTVRCVFP